MDILFKQEILSHLELPSIPSDKYKWDGKTSFKFGIAITTLAMERKAYAVCTFDSEKDDAPRVTKTFAQEPFYEIGDIYVVPSFMDMDVDNMDLDEESKRAAERLAQEAKELSETKEDEELMQEIHGLPEWVFPNIHNVEEARAFIQSWNASNKIKGKIPKNEETLKLRLLTIYQEQNKKNK